MNTPRTWSSIATRFRHPSTSLFIIGNGFDLAHNVPSSYNNFRNWLCVNDEHLKEIIERTLVAESTDMLWWNFEDSLGHIRPWEMLEKVNVAMCDYGMPTEREFPQLFDKALRYGTGDIDYIKRNLLPAFSKWVDTLDWNIENPIRPFGPLIDPVCHEALFMNFNYTEFLSTWYRVPRDRIFYPHGCRADNSGEEIVLGHSPGAYEQKLYASGAGISSSMIRKNRQAWSHAQGEAIAKIRSFKLHTTKSAIMIISENSNWFKSMVTIQDFIVLGHSLSKVDYLYFKELIEKNNDISSTHWYITFYEPEERKYASSNMKRIKSFIDEMGLRKDQITLLRLGNEGEILES